jgi:hypothetical protein
VSDHADERAVAQTGSAATSACATLVGEPTEVSRSTGLWSDMEFVGELAVVQQRLAACRDLVARRSDRFARPGPLLTQKPRSRPSDVRFITVLQGA